MCSRTSAIAAVPFDPAKGAAEHARAIEIVLGHAFAQIVTWRWQPRPRSAKILVPYWPVELLVIDAWMEGLADFEAALYAGRGAASAIGAFLRFGSTHAPAIVDVVEQSC